MIDWYTGLLGYSGEGLRLNTICELSPDGNMIWQTEGKTKARGSFDTSVQIGRKGATAAMLSASRAYGFQCPPVCLYLSGNPSKFLQGHNVFGPPVASLGPVMRAVVRGLPDDLRPVDSFSDLWPSVHRGRVDITTSVDLGSHNLVHEWLRTAEVSTRSRHGRPFVSGTTVYWGQHSRRWALKAYCKFCELEVHQPDDKKLYGELREYCQGHLRIELCLRTPELKPRGTLSEELIWDFMKKIEVGVMKKDVDLKKPNLTLHHQFTLNRWMSGEDVRQSLSRPTFYRHRLVILAELGLDISLTYQKKTAEKIVFDLAYLRAHEVKIIPASMQGRLFKPESSPAWNCSSSKV
jgi:hypothetical protein